MNNNAKSADARSMPHRLTPSLLKRERFTLIELLVVVAIIAILAAILLPALSRAKYQANLTLCISNMKQVGIGVITYMGDNDEWYPCGNEPRAYTNQLDYGTGGSTSDVNNIRPLVEDYYGNTWDVWLCPLARDAFAKTAAWMAPTYHPWNSTVSYSLYANSFGRGAMTGLKGGAYVVTINSLDYDNIMRKEGQAFTLTSGQKFRILASDACKYSQWQTPNNMLLNHQGWGNNKTLKDYCGARAWFVQYTEPAPQSMTVVRDDGSVELHRGQMRPLGHGGTTYRPGASDDICLPKEEALP